MTTTQLITVRQAAEQWAVSKQHIQNLINLGTLPVVYIPSKTGGKLQRINQQDLDALITRG